VHGPGRTCFDTLETSAAGVAVNGNPAALKGIDCTGRAGFLASVAFAAANAFVRIIGEFRRRNLGLGIATPAASKRTAFQKYNGSDPGAVMH